MRLDFQTLAFKALTAIVERLTSRKVTISTVYFEWTAPVCQVKVPNNDVEGLLHEFCHWLVAQRSLRDTANYGLEDEECPTMTASRAQQQLREERMCGFIEDELYARAGIERMHSSVDEAKYLLAPRLKRSALLKLQAIGAQEINLIVRALTLEGGQACAYSDPPSVWPFGDG
jgi:hypothetical protein